MSTKEEIKSEDIRDARELVQSMLKAKKNLRLYPPNNPMYGKVVDASYERVSDLLEFHNKIELKITRNEILLGTEPVFQGESKDDNLALFFFRDGLRTLAFEKELARSEFQHFLEIITVDFDSESVEDDLVTLLWEKDFQHIKYTVDESSMLEDEEYSEKAVHEAQDGAMEEDNITHAYQDAMGLEEVEKMPPVQVSEEDLKALATEMQQGSEDKIGKLTDILFDMLFLAETLDEFRDIANIISKSVSYSIRHDNIEDALTVLARTRGLMDRSKNENLKKYLSQVFTTAGSPPLVKALGEALDSKEGIDEKMFARYVSLLNVNAIPSFINLLGELESISGRKNVINALSFLGKKDIPSLLKGLKDSRWFVVRNIIHAIRRIGDNRAVEPLIKTLGHSDVRVRKEVIRSLGDLGRKNKDAVDALVTFIYDPDKSVRLTSVRALGATGSEYAKAAIIQKLSERKTQNLDFEEIKEFFDVLGRWRDDDVMNFVMSIISRNPLFGRSRYNDFKAGAAHALGIAGKMESADTLEKLRASKHRLLSETATSALRRLKYVRK